MEDAATEVSPASAPSPAAPLVTTPSPPPSMLNGEESNDDDDEDEEACGGGLGRSELADIYLSRSELADIVRSVMGETAPVCKRGRRRRS